MGVRGGAPLAAGACPRYEDESEAQEEEARLKVMAHPLEGARRKLDRAEEHLRAFDAESGDWLEKTTYCRFVFQDHGDERWYFADLVVAPPSRLSAILGDCIQNLRASLDYLAWELVKANHLVPTRYTAFPIYRKAPGPKFSPNSVAGIDPKAVALIEELQPYYGGKNPDTDWLEFLSQLSNTDKHRALNVVVGQIVINGFRIYVDFPSGQKVFPPAWREAGVLHHGAKAAMYPRDAFQGGEYVKVEADAVGFITLGEALPWGAHPVSRNVEGAYRYIRDDVFPRFAPFFP